MKKIITLIAIITIAHLSYGQNKPNVVYILVDNWGWGDISIQGSTTPTPQIDKLATEGMRFTNFNVQNQCTPTRSALMTGRLPIRSGTQKVGAPGEPGGMSPWEYTIAELLSDAGYSTAAFGKWHIGDRDGRLPHDQGFDVWYGIKESAMAASFSSTPQFDPEIFDLQYIWEGKKGEKATKVKEFNLETRADLDIEIVNKTNEFIKSKAKSKKPFYVYTALTQIHPPFLPQSGFEGKSGSGEYADIQMQVDYNVGKILETIKDAGIEDNTIVILTGDNAAGEQSAEWQGEGGSNGPWRGGLSTGYEGGMRTTGMIKWLGKIAPGKVTDEIISDLDWYPTIANIVNEEAKIPTDRPIDGINQSDFILGKQDKSNREHVITYVGDDVFSVKWRTIKVHFFTAEGTFAPIIKSTFPKMYDIKNDPGETKELWRNEGYSHIYLMEPIMKILTEKSISMKQYPNIKPGEEFKGYNK
jgi:arylsulfatase A-like enzyme